MTQNYSEIQEKIDSYQGSIQELTKETEKVIFGAKNSIEFLLMAILSGGHVLLEGNPGLAKTLLAETFSKLLELDFHRIQFTPDLLPADILGGQVFNQASGNFSIRKGPLFSQVLLVDEINRAPAKVQSALLEAMAEKKVHLAGEEFQMEEPYFVIATQNPIEQEGTYPLPEAQLDRFIFKLLIDYPHEQAEHDVLRHHATLKKPIYKPVIKADQILSMRSLCEQIHIDDKVLEYIVKLVRISRPSAQMDDDLAQYIQTGASPRAGLALLRSARALAMIRGRAFITPDDVRHSFYEVMRHRILLSFQAMAENVSTDDMIAVILEKVAVPVS